MEEDRTKDREDVPTTTSYSPPPPAASGSVMLNYLSASFSLFVERAVEKQQGKEEEYTFSNMTPADPPSYVPVAFKSANGN